MENHLFCASVTPFPHTQWKGRTINEPNCGTWRATTFWLGTWIFPFSLHIRPGIGFSHLDFPLFPLSFECIINRCGTGNGFELWLTAWMDEWFSRKLPKVHSWQKARNNIILLANYTGRSELYCGKLNFFNGTYAVLKFFRVTARRERTNSSSFHPLNWTGPKKSVSLNMKTQLTYQGGWWFSW